MSKKNVSLIDSIMPDEFQQAKINHLMNQATMIAEALGSKGWSKGKFAQIMHQQPSVISKWLSGTHNFTSLTLFEIQRVLGVKFFAENTKSNTPAVLTQTALSINIFVSHSEKVISVPKAGRKYTMPATSQMQIIQTADCEQN